MRLKIKRDAIEEMNEKATSVLFCLYLFQVAVVNLIELDDDVLQNKAGLVMAATLIAIAALNIIFILFVLVKSLVVLVTSLFNLVSGKKKIESKEAKDSQNRNVDSSNEHIVEENSQVNMKIKPANNHLQEDHARLNKPIIRKAGSRTRANQVMASKNTMSTSLSKGSEIRERAESSKKILPSEQKQHSVPKDSSSIPNAKAKVDPSNPQTKKTTQRRKIRI